MSKEIRLETVTPTGGGSVIQFESVDGVPFVVVETWGHNSMPVQARRPMTHEEVNLIRRWTEEAYPRSQER